MHIHCVWCTLLERRRVSWSCEMLRPHIEQGGGGGGAIAGGDGCGHFDRGRTGALNIGALDGGWEPRVDVDFLAMDDSPSGVAVEHLER